MIKQIAGRISFPDGVVSRCSSTKYRGVMCYID